LELKIRIDKGEALIAILKATLGSVPLVGPFLAEAAGVTIPNLRIERLEKLAAFLAEQSYGQIIDSAHMQERLKDPKFLDLLEDGVAQAVRALSEDRLRRIAMFLFKGMSADEFDYITQKRMLALFGELNDAEVMILVCTAAADGKRQHPYNVLDAGKHLSNGDLDPTDRSYLLSVYDSYIDHLIALRLLRDGDLSDLVRHQYGDQKMLIKRPLYYIITPLGWLMLQHVGGIDTINQLCESTDVTERPTSSPPVI